MSPYLFKGPPNDNFDERTVNNDTNIILFDVIKNPRDKSPGMG